jgi:predicted NAD/FAD-dependent oxidoreductase
MKKIAIIGAGMAGITAARTLKQAGFHVSVFDKSTHASGRMSGLSTPLGSFDQGAQYFTVRDPRFLKALEEVPGTVQVVRAWGSTAVRVLDARGRVLEASHPSREPHFVAQPSMGALVEHWAQPLMDDGQIHLEAQVHSIQKDQSNPKLWQLRLENESDSAHAGFDGVILAIPAPQAQKLIDNSTPSVYESRLRHSFKQVQMGPCWTLMVAFAQASQLKVGNFGPQWNAAKSTNHRIAWLSRESSKPSRSRVERWTIQASTEWSQEHLGDDHDRIQAKMLKAFAELSGIYAQPSQANVKLWQYAKTLKPLGVTHQWDEKLNIGTCGDWHLGHRVENAFVSGLSLALSLV